MDRRIAIRHAASFGMILLVAVAFNAFAVYLLTPWLRDKVVVEYGTIDRWLEIYERWAVALAWFAWFAASAWYLLGSWRYRVVHWEEGKKRLTWALLLGAVVVSVVGAVLLLPPVQRGGYVAILGYAFVGLGCYYVSTLFLSPPSHKYAPVGSVAVRRW